MRQLERTVGLRDLSIVEMEGKMREMSAATFDGVFVWKISDFTKKRQDAVAGRAPAMFSPGNGMALVMSGVTIRRGQDSLEASQPLQFPPRHR